jgi:hypothetical protein
MEASTSKSPIRENATNFPAKLRRKIVRTYMLVTEIVAFVVGLCQSGKTGKSVDVMMTKVVPSVVNYVCFLTQSGNASIVKQTVDRLMSREDVDDSFTTIGDYKEVNNVIGNTIIVGQYITYVRDKMVSLLRKDIDIIGNIIIIIDEVDQGETSMSSINGRLGFIDTIGDIARVYNKRVNIIVMTASAAFMCKKINECNYEPIRGGIVQRMKEEDITGIYKAPIGNEYAGTEYFLNKPENIKYFEQPQKTKDQSPIEYASELNDVVVSQARLIPDEKRKYTLFAANHLIVSHIDLAQKLIDESIYNVAITFNSDGKPGSRKMLYKSTITGETKTVEIPEKIVFDSIKKDKISVRNLTNNDGRKVVLESKDVTVQHIYQAILGVQMPDMNREDRLIIDRLRTFLLRDINSNNRLRLDDFPLTDNIRLAFVAGHLVGRGITIQNKNARFLFSSFVITTKSGKEKNEGSYNYQRFGRMFGYYADFFDKINPIILCGVDSFADSIANTDVVEEISPEDGVLYKIGDIVSSRMYYEARKNALRKIAESEKRKYQVKEEENDAGPSNRSPSTSDYNFDDNEEEEEYDPIEVKRIQDVYKRAEIVRSFVNVLMKYETPIKFEILHKESRYKGDVKAFKSNILNGGSVKAKYGLIWYYGKTYGGVILTPIARHAIKTL